MLPALLAPILFRRNGTHSNPRWPGGIKSRAIASASILLAIPACRWVLPADINFSFLTNILALAIIAITTIFMAVCAWMHRKHPWRKSPHRLAASWFAAHTRMASLVMLSGWLALTHVEEKTWAQRDTLFVFSTERHALSTNEGIVSQRLRAQTLDTLGPEWQP